MNIKLSVLLESIQSLRQLQEVKLPAKLAFKLSKTMRAVDEHLKDFQAQRDAVLADTDKSDEDRRKELQDLAEMEVELPNFGLNIDAFSDMEIATSVFTSLDWLITD